MSLPIQLQPALWAGVPEQDNTAPLPVLGAINCGGSSITTGNADWTQVSSQAFASGDYALAILYNDQSRSFSAASDNSGDAGAWTMLTTRSFGTMRMRMALKKFTSTVASGFTVTGTVVNSCAKLYRVLKLTGIDGSSPVDVTGTLATGTAGTAVSSDITPVAADSLIIANMLAIVADADGAATIDATFTTLGTQLNRTPVGKGVTSYRQVHGTSLVTKADTLATARDWMSAMTSFKAA